MWLGLFIITVVIVGLLSLSLWMKEIYDTHHSSGSADCVSGSDNNSCTHCGIKDISNCAQN